MVRPKTAGHRENAAHRAAATVTHSRVSPTVTTLLGSSAKQYPVLRQDEAKRGRTRAKRSSALQLQLHLAQREVCAAGAATAEAGKH